MMKTDHSKRGLVATAIERFADGVGPVALLGLGLAAAVALASAGSF